MLTRSVLVKIRLKDDGPHVTPPCPACQRKIEGLTLAAPSLVLRVWSWLIGRGWVPTMFVVMTPCGHATSQPSTVASVTLLVGQLVAGLESDSVELVEALHG